jgi:YD repeat-containing protein
VHVRAARGTTTFGWDCYGYLKRTARNRAKKRQVQVLPAVDSSSTKADVAKGDAKNSTFVTLKQKQLVVRQMDMQVGLEVTRTGDASQAVSVKLSTKDGSGAFGMDHFGLSKDTKKEGHGKGGRSMSLTIGAGETVAMVGPRQHASPCGADT